MAKVKKKPISPFQKLCGTSPAWYCSSFQGSWLPKERKPCFEMGCIQWSFFSSGLSPVEKTFYSAKTPVCVCIIANKGWGWGACMSDNTHVSGHAVNPRSLRETHVPPTEVSSEPRVSGCRWTPGSQTTVIKQGNKAKDLENVWGAPQDLGPRLHKLHPNGHWWWHFHCTNGMWHFSELMMIEQVESERQAFSSRGRLAVWSSDGEMNLLFDHKQ